MDSSMKERHFHDLAAQQRIDRTSTQFEQETAFTCVFSKVHQSTTDPCCFWQLWTILLGTAARSMMRRGSTITSSSESKFVV